MTDNFPALLDKRRPDIQKMLAEWITPERFFAMAALVRRIPLLATCSDESLVECVVAAAQLGLEVGGTRGHFYCVPYGKEAQGQPGWRGLAFLRLKAGSIMQLDTDVVFKGDIFRISRTSKGDEFVHELNFGNERKEKDAVAAYARVILPTGETQFEVCSRDRVLRHRGHSKQPDGMLWNPQKFWEEGWRKTPYRILDKRLPEGQNAEAMERYMRAADLDAAHFTPGADEDFERMRRAEKANEEVGTPPSSRKVEPEVEHPAMSNLEETISADEERALTEAASKKGLRHSALLKLINQKCGIQIDELDEIKKGQTSKIMDAIAEA
jgi:phage RecT family recombinase